MRGLGFGLGTTFYAFCSSFFLSISSRVLYTAAAAALAATNAAAATAAATAAGRWDLEAAVTAGSIW